MGNGKREASVATTSYLLSRMLEMKSYNRRKSSAIIDEMEEEIFHLSSNHNNAFPTPLPDTNGQSMNKKGLATIMHCAPDDDVFAKSGHGCCNSIAVNIQDIYKCNSMKNGYSDERMKSWNSEFNINKLPVRYRVAILFIHRINLWIAMKNFKNVRNPFLNMEDMMEKNVRHHGEMLNHFTELNTSFNSIQRQFDTLQTSNNELKAMVTSLTEMMMQNVQTAH